VLPPSPARFTGNLGDHWSYGGQAVVVLEKSNIPAVRSTKQNSCRTIAAEQSEAPRTTTSTRTIPKFRNLDLGGSKKSVARRSESKDAYR
jgi:hypothetical protein